MISPLHSLWVILLGVLYYFIYHRENYAYQQIISSTSPQESTPEKLSTPVITKTLITSTSLQVNFTLSSQEGIMNALLLPSNINLNQKTMQEIISTRALDPHAKSIQFSERNLSLSFYQLKENSTYYLYFYEKSTRSKLASEIGHLSFQTKEMERSWSHLKIDSEYLIHICVVLLVVVLAKWSWTWMQVQSEKKAFLKSGRGNFGPLANKVANEWNLDLPKVHKKIKLQLRTETLEGKSQEAKEEMKKANNTLENGNYEYEERRICGLCCERPREVVFLNCGHIYCCIKCSVGLSKCPLDKKPIEKIIRYKVADSRDLVEWTSFTKLKHIWSDKFGGNMSQGSIKEVKGQLDDAEYFSLLKDEQTNYQYFYKCMICNHRDKEVVFEDCQHLVCCEKCAKSCRSCPLDNVQTTRMHHVYFS